MNILPYVIFFISILSISSMGLFKGCQVTELSSHFFHSYMVAERDARNFIETHTYIHAKNSHKEKDPPKKSKETTIQSLPDRNKSYLSFRNKRLTENSKLNIAPLFFREELMLKNTLIRLLKEVYSHAPFMQNTNYDIDLLCKDLVETLISMNIGIPLKELCLSKMEFSNETLRHVWYKMLRGTNPYSMQKKDGWPPLSSLLMIHPNKQRSPICFNKASTPILIAYLGQEATEEILELEYENYLNGKKPLSLEENSLDNILAKHTLTSHKKLIQMNGIKKSLMTTQGFDKTSGIIVELSSIK